MLRLATTLPSSLAPRLSSAVLDSGSPQLPLPLAHTRPLWCPPSLASAAPLWSPPCLARHPSRCSSSAPRGSRQRLPGSAPASGLDAGDPSPSPPAAPGMEGIRAKLQEIIQRDPKGGWDQAWQQSMSPWDLGGVTPAVAALLEAGAVPPGAKSVLVPGCGGGYDVVALAQGGRVQAVGLDISETALARARELSSGKPGSESVSFVNQDFFSFQPDTPFDVIFDYTFFCALQPSMRPAWAKQTASLLAPEGTLFTLIFPIGDHEGGPPFAVSLQAYEELLGPLGLQGTELPTVSHPSRAGKEKLVQWTRGQPARI